MTDNRLTPEELNSFCEWLTKFLEEAAHHQETINRQKAEIERLKRLLAEADITYNKCAKRFYKEGVEDFAKRLKDRPRKHLLLRPDSYYKQYVRVTDIDSLKKEMVGAE